MVKLIGLSKFKEKGIGVIEATFQIDGGLTPLKVIESDRRDSYNKALEVIDKVGHISADKIASELYDIMSPIGKVQKTLTNSASLSGKLVLEDGVLRFGEFILEDSLARHMLSLLDEENVPKDEKMWKAYVAFLDNLHQNVSEDIREQLFKWIAYENKAGHAFGFTDDGCIIGYKGCGGTVMEPESVFEGFAIVDGVEHKGKIPNKVGSVVRMPRLDVQHDPTVGCSVGLHVGTRDYAIQWAPILTKVKVNPRDIVSVPYECDSQKMRVCEYTVLEVVDKSDEHSIYSGCDDEYECEDEFYEDDNDFSVGVSEYDNEDITEALAESFVGLEVYVEYSAHKSFEGVVVNYYPGNKYRGNAPGIVVRQDEEYKHIKLNDIDYIQVYEEWDEEYEIDIDEDELETSHLEDMVGLEATVTYKGGKVFEGVIVDIHKSDNPGVILKSEDGEYKHIKCTDIDEFEVVEFGSEINGLEGVEIGDEVIITQETKLGEVKVQGRVLAIDNINEKVLLNTIGSGVMFVSFEAITVIEVL